MIPSSIPSMKTIHQSGQKNSSLATMVFQIDIIAWNKLIHFVLIYVEACQMYQINAGGSSIVSFHFFLGRIPSGLIISQRHCCLLLCFRKFIPIIFRDFGLSFSIPFLLVVAQDFSCKLRVYEVPYEREYQIQV